MNGKFDKLCELGAGEFEHLNGSLIKHLNNTYQILEKWGASQVLCDSGLYHAAYGTAGFEAQVVSLSKRNDIAEIIGKAAEEIVYLDCSCDRGFVFNHFDGNSAIKFRDRFTHTEFEFIKEHGQGLLNLFIKMKPLLSKPANETVTRVLGSVA